MKNPKDGFFRAKAIDLFRCYALPSPTLLEYKQLLSGLILDTRGHMPKMLAVDFNAWIFEWGRSTTNVGGHAPLEAESDTVFFQRKGPGVYSGPDIREYNFS